MNDKEWRRNELFHLLMEKFDLGPLNEFNITGTGLADLAPTPWGQSQIPSSSGDAEEIDFAGSQDSSKDSYVSKAVIPDIPQPSKNIDSLNWDSNLDQGVSFKADDKDFGQQLDVFKSAIASKESGHLGYEALGIPVHEYGYDGDRARGKYQIMGKNWPKWAKEAGLSENSWDPNTGMTPKNQEYVASFKFKQYYNQFGGDWRKVAIAWYSGPGGMEKKANNYKKVYHKGHDKPFPSIAEYGDDIVGRMKNVKTT